MKKCNNNYTIHNQQAKIAKGGEGMQELQEQEKQCEMTIDEKIGFERLERGEIVRAQNGNKLLQERTQNLK